MRMLKKFACVLTVLCMLCALSLNAFAAEEYTYTVRIYSGKQGSISGGEVVTYTDLHYGDRVTFNQNTVTLNDGSKYYIRGIREAGKDNDTSLANASFTVTGDMDYVVCYGLLGSSVAYTVNYVDASGNTLAPSETYYGNVGDSPVIAYLYMDGYRPQAYNLTGELLADASQNVFTFVYTPIPAIGTTVITTTGGGTGTGTTGTAGTAGTTGAGTGTTGTADTTTPAGTGADNTADTTTDTTTDNTTDTTDANTEPEEIEDIREDETPLAPGEDATTDTTTDSDSQGLTAPALVAIGTAIAVVIAGVVVYFVRKRSHG